MGDETAVADAIKGALGSTTSTGTIPCTGLDRSDPATPIEIELALGTHSADGNIPAKLVGNSYDTLAALGVDATDGAPVVKQHYTVTGADGAKGVVLPELLVQDYSFPIVIHNADATNTLKVWGNTTGTDDTINGATHFLVPAKCIAMFFPLAASAWYGGVITIGIAKASADQAVLALDVDVTGADTVDKAAINTNFTAIQTLVNQLRSDLIAAGVIKGAA